MDHETDHENGTGWRCEAEPDLASRRVGLFLLYLFMLVAGLALNLTALWVNWQRRRNPVVFCVLNVGVADTMLVLMLPVSMLEAVLDHVWLWGDFLCRFSNLLIVTNIFSSCFFVAYLSVERYLALVRVSAPRPAAGPERRRRYAVAAALWILALFCASMETAHMKVMDTHEPGCYLQPEHDFLGWYSALISIQFLLQYLLPSVIIVTSNALLARAARSSPGVQQGGGGGGVWLLHLYSAAFVACWFPYHAVLILILVAVDLAYLETGVFDCSFSQQLYYAYSITCAVAMLHCLANPVLYSYLSRSFRNKLVSLVLSRLPQGAAANLHANDARANKGEGREKSGTSQSEDQDGGA